MASPAASARRVGTRILIAGGGLTAQALAQEKEGSGQVCLRLIGKTYMCTGEEKALIFMIGYVVMVVFVFVVFVLLLLWV